MYLHHRIGSCSTSPEDLISLTPVFSPRYHHTPTTRMTIIRETQIIGIIIRSIIITMRDYIHEKPGVLCNPPASPAGTMCDTDNFPASFFSSLSLSLSLFSSTHGLDEMIIRSWFVRLYQRTAVPPGISIKTLNKQDKTL